MGRDGYKGLAFVDEHAFVVCDDGEHVLYLGVLDRYYFSLEFKAM